MNEMLYDIIDGEETFVGFCYVHQGRRVIHPDVDGCQHHVCTNLRLKPDPTQPMFNITRFKQENAGGWTQSEVEQDVIDAAKRDGREIQRPSQ